MSDGIHITQKGERWLVTRGNYTLDEFPSKQQALQLARQRAKSSRANVIVHAEDGSVRYVENFTEFASGKDKKRKSA
jgi:hypothetical protein